MGTRANIGMVQSDGTVRYIYTHWDGYPTHHGPLLTEHYATEDKVKALIDLGDLSVLNEVVGEKHPFDRPRHDTDENLDWEQKYGKMCHAYGRDREEEDTGAHTATSEKAYFKEADNDYTYLFKDGKWVYRPGTAMGTFPLEAPFKDGDPEDDDE